MQKAALYLRLSRDAGDGAESESISAQRVFLMEYCRKNSFEIAGIYVDDGFSGTNFDRPGFSQMIKDALDGRFRIVITKDMSRLGRDYIATGEYIERFFPENGIRYIAVNDGVDTEFDSDGNDMIAIKAVFNDMYAKDISKKVRTALDSKKACGKFIGSSAPYGYKKDEKDKNRLVPDENTRANVKRIFDEFIGGKNMSEISRGLTADRVPTPSEQKNIGTRKSPRWNSVMIKRILSNPTYAGNLTQGFEKRLSYKSKKRIKVRVQERITVLRTHEGIVDKETFEKACARLKKYKSL